MVDEEEMGMAEPAAGWELEGWPSKPGSFAGEPFGDQHGYASGARVGWNSKRRDELGSGGA